MAGGWCRQKIMAYFADLTPYSYIRGAARENERNIGWLDSDHSFAQGPVSERVLATVFTLCKAPVNQTRGFHPCVFCSSGPAGIQATYDGTTLLLGSAEIRVPSRAGLVYAAPNMIYHYIKDHHYQPPQEFIDAVSELVSVT